MVNTKTIDPTEWSEAVRKLKEAGDEYQAAEREETAARSRLTNATNKLNEAQKEMDRLMRVAREGAPWNTDWSSERKRGSAAA